MSVCAYFDVTHPELRRLAVHRRALPLPARSGGLLGVAAAAAAWYPHENLTLRLDLCRNGPTTGCYGRRAIFSALSSPSGWISTSAWTGFRRRGTNCGSSGNGSASTRTFAGTTAPLPTAHCRTPEPVSSFTVNNLGFQLRYRYEIGPLSELFVVYGRGGFDLMEGDERDVATRLFGDMSTCATPISF